MTSSSRSVFHLRSFALLVLALMVLTQPLLNVAVALNLGDCEEGTYGVETPKECTNKLFCSNAGCVPYAGEPNSCGVGFAVVTIDIAAADRIKTGTCSTAANQACAQCSGMITCAKGDAYRSANCVNSCSKVRYFRTAATDRCI